MHPTLAKAVALLNAGDARGAEPLLKRLAMGSADAALPACAALARALHELGQREPARFFAGRAAGMAPTRPDDLLLASAMLIHAGFFAEASRVGERALGMVGPGTREEGLVRCNRAVALAELGRYAEAEADAARAWALDPTSLEAGLTLARILDETGRSRALVTHLSEVAQRFPEHLEARTTHACAILNDADRSPGQVFEAHREVGRLVESLAPEMPAPPPRPAGRPLRVGFLSADLRDHSVAYFLEPILEEIRGAAPGVFVAAYSTSSRADQVTARLRERVDLWRDASRLSDGAAAGVIRADDVDVLVDLGGYTQGCRPLIAARRPARAQVNYLGYPFTLGSTRWDARLVDSRTDPSPTADAWANERLVRLDPCFVCYRPPRREEWPGRDHPPDVRARGAGRPMTFASFNAMRKVSDGSVALWSRVLEAVPGSRLMLRGVGFAAESARAWAAERFAGHGVDPARLDLLPLAPAGTQLAGYHGADIALDPFPYQGTTTTCEALFMGVPVVSLTGASHPQRVGLSLLSGVGLEALAAETEVGFVAAAAGLARDPARLASLRAGLRDRLAGSVLCDARGFAARFAGALEEIVARAGTR